MARRKDQPDQSLLFGDSPIERALDVVMRARELAWPAGLPERVRFGTSSWSFPGWAGIVYARQHSEADLARNGLAAYASHPLFRTVGLDRAFYQPLSVQEYERLASLTPAGFRFLIKAHQAITRPHAADGAPGRTFGDTAALAEGGAANPLFLDVQYAIDRVIGPAAVGLKEKAGPIVFQFPPMPLRGPKAVMTAAALIDRVGEFVSRLPRAGSDRWGGPRYVVEFRSREVVDRDHVARYASMLRAAGGLGVSHGWVVHPSMPTIEEQVASLESTGHGPRQQPVLSVRWLLKRTLSYDGARERYAPFAKIVDDDAPTRAEVLRLIRASLAAARETFVIVNNKAEGSAPLTIVRIADELRRDYEADMGPART